jgi:hypothetical protein
MNVEYLGKFNWYVEWEPKASVPYRLYGHYDPTTRVLRMVVQSANWTYRDMDSALHTNAKELEPVFDINGVKDIHDVMIRRAEKEAAHTK